LTGHPGDVASNIPGYPMARAAGCPLAPAPVALELNTVKPLSRVRIWDGSTPWLITGYDAIRSLFNDSRASVDDRKPGYPHWNEGMLATVHMRPRSVFTADGEEHTTFSAHAVEAVHFQAGRGLASRRPEDHR
jgi:cytochrome P450